MKNRKSRRWRSRWVALCAGVALGVGATAASAALIDIDVSGAEAHGDEGNASNTVLNVDLNALLGTTPGAAVEIDAIGWDVTIEAFSPSWLSEATVSFSDSSLPAELLLTAGVGDDIPGIESYSGFVVLADAGISNLVLPDGNLRLEFFDTFDDGNRPQAVWFEGSTITVRTIEDVEVPAPATWLLFVAGIAALAAGRRRRVGG